MNIFSKLTFCFVIIYIFTYVESYALEENRLTRPSTLSFADRCYFSRFACHCLRKPRDLKCGSNGLTYRNKCAIHCYNKHCPRKITIDHSGSCESAKTLPQTSSKPTNCDSNACICTMIYEPVCGNNGVTYSNSCTFRCAQKCNSDLQLYKSQPC